MCGMTGWVSYDGDIPQHRDIIAKMTSTMVQRGPDEEGMWFASHVGLGHRRLAVIDVLGGAQPMLAEEQGRELACLVYTGEIYNFLELRSELESLGHRFRTRCDTEVVLRGYLQWKDQLAEHLNGMFAFAIWDIRNEELFLVRDRMGIKPLFYFPTPDGVIFSSEPKGILAHPAVEARVTRAGLQELLVIARNPGCTVYSGMHEVKPGEIVRVRRGTLITRQYWRLTAHEHEDDLPQTIATVTALLEDIVTRQVVSDVPLCSLLSGGLDSSAITALAHRVTRSRTRDQICSFSVDFARAEDTHTGQEYRSSADTPYVHDFVAHTGCDHVCVVLESGELANSELVRAVVRAADFPLNISGDMFTSLYRLFQRIRANFTVALSGESADEVFGGYSWFHDPRLQRVKTFPWFVITEGGFGGLAPEFLERLGLGEFRADSYAQAVAEVPHLPTDNAPTRRMREILYLHLTRFLRYLLDRKDRLSMAVGLEVRVPFCDHRLIEYAFNTPWSMHTFDGREKSILRAAANSLLPASIVSRRKSPYPSTADPRYERALRTAVAAILAEPNHPAQPILNRRAIQGMIARPPGSLADRVNLERVHSMSVWIKDYHIRIEA